MIDWPVLVGIIAYSVVEYWLGETKKVKPNSVIGLGLTIGKNLLTVSRKKAQDKYILPPRK